jgi:DNA-binding response OmpR family regulator
MSTILVFDNSSVTRHTVSMQLITYGFDTLQARSIGSARVALASKPVDLVILDLAAPDAGGMTLLRELRHDRTHRKLPVVILTSSTRDSDRIDARAAGAVAFLTKPVSTRELLFTVNSALALHGPVKQLEQSAGSHAPRVPFGRAARPEWAIPLARFTQ